ncbi:uncharacterized protein LOC134654792 [Cydia amplana]|uniref:uncharacterized protein LOC134654792 n=1 Tax=Cydia amplana TaxID=1869771 RepID=UPI002FE5C5D7
MSGNESNMPHRPSSDVGFERADEREDGTQSEQSGTHQDQNWRLLFEMQNSNMKALIEALHKPQQSGKHVNLPEFDPDKTDVDAQSWCATADLCFADNPLEGGQLIVVISKALKGVASAWLSQISYAGMTWPQFKELFRDRFVSAETTAATLINLTSDKPKENETLAAYGSRVMTSLLNRWKKATIEQIAVSQTLAHLAQFDTRLQRLAFTTEINTRQKLQQELQAFTYLKRKFNAVGDQKATDNKRMKMSPGIKCFHCGKKGHKLSDCLFRKKDGKAKPVKPQQNTTMTKPNHQQQTTSSAIVCFKCGTTGHIASRCTSGGAEATAVRERRVDVCEVDPPAGTAKHQGQCFTFHYDSGAECSAVKESIAFKFSGKPENNVVSIKGITKSSILSTEQILCVVEINNHLIEILLHVLPDDYLSSDILIGREILRQGFGVVQTEKQFNVFKVNTDHSELLSSNSINTSSDALVTNRLSVNDFSAVDTRDRNRLP